MKNCNTLPRAFPEIIYSMEDALEEIHPMIDRLSDLTINQGFDC